MKENINHLKKLFANKTYRYAIYGIGTLFILSLTFQVGMSVGYHKASYGRDWGEHYEKNFGMMRPDSMRSMMGGGRFPMAHGAVGKIISVTLPTFILEDKDGTEKTVLLNETTLIKKAMERASSTELSANSFVVVLGEPNSNGQIEAKLIRIMPDGFSTSTNNFPPQGMMFNR